MTDLPGGIPQFLEEDTDYFGCPKRMRFILRVNPFITSYFYMNDSSVCSEYIIKTHYGHYTIPIIGVKHMRSKEKIKKELTGYALPKLKKKRKQLYNMYFIYYTDLPVEIIHYIMDFY